MGAADQRRRDDAQEDRRSSRRRRAPDPLHHAGSVPQLRPARLREHPDRAAGAARRRHIPRSLQARRAPHCYRRAAGARGAALLSQARDALHDGLSHAVSALPAHARAGAAGAHVRLPAVVPRAGGADAGPDGVDAARSRRARLSPRRAVGTRRRLGSLPSARQGLSRRAASDLHLCRPHRRLTPRWPRAMKKKKIIHLFPPLALPGTKYVVGEGPYLKTLKQQFPDARYAEIEDREEFAKYVAAADVFVFPSRSDTFGLVLLEAMASGVPVAAFPVTGPADVIENGITGVLDNDLRAAALGAGKLDGRACRAFALGHTWRAAARQFLQHVETAVGGVGPREAAAPVPDLARADRA